MSIGKVQLDEEKGRVRAEAGRSGKEFSGVLVKKGERSCMIEESRDGRN